MLELSTGTFPQIESALLQELLRQKKADPLGEVLVLSPSGHLLTRLQHQLSAKLDGALNLHFLSFYGLADRLLSDSEVPPDRVVTDPALYVEAIRQLLEGSVDVEFKSRAAFLPPGRPLSRGLALALSGTLRDLRDSGARVVDSLRAALEGHLGDATPEAAATLELYARLYELLQKRGLRTSADQLRRAADLLPRHPFLQRQKKIFLYGFYDLTGVQLDFVLRFAALGKAHVYCPYVSGDARYAFAEKLLRDPALLSKVGKTSRVSPVDIPPAPPTSVINCSGIADEVWIATKKILEWVDEGLAPADILVTARSLGPYAAALRESFELHHVPYAMAFEEPVGAFPLMKAARQLISLEEHRYAFGMVFDVFKSPYFRFPEGFIRVNADLAERVARQVGIISGWETWNERLAHWAQMSPPKEFLESISSTLTEDQARDQAKHLWHLIDELHSDLSSSCDEKARWSHHARWAQRLLDRWMGLPPGASSEERHLWKGLQESLRGLSTLDALHHPITRSHFLETWGEKLDAFVLPLAPSNNAGVQVIDLLQARGLQYQATIVLGMNEKSFPRLIREDPFLSDTARGALAQALGCRLARKLDGYGEERLLFELVQQTAQKNLFLTYQRSDEEGKALIPSLYLQELPSRPSAQHLPRTFVEKWSQIPVTQLLPKEISVLLNRENADPEVAYKAFGYDWTLYSTLRRAQDDIESFDHGLGPRDGVTGPTARTKEVLKVGFSPDSLQALAECPFRFFARQVLSLKPLQPMVEEGDLAADATGKLIHRILETFYRNLTIEPVMSQAKALHAELDQTCLKVFTAFQSTAADLYPVAWKATQRNIANRLHRFLDKDLQELTESGFRPAIFELPVAGELIELGPSMKGIPFHGRVDRVDLRQEGGKSQYRVVDYKTGRPSLEGKTETAVLRGRYLQLPIYLSLAKLEVERRLKAKPAPDCAAFYNFADMETGRESPALTANFWIGSGTEFAENLNGLIKLIDNGVFYIRPSEGIGYCDWCEYSEACRKEHKPTAIRSESSPVRQLNDGRLSRSASD